MTRTESQENAYEIDTEPDSIYDLNLTKLPMRTIAITKDRWYTVDGMEITVRYQRVINYFTGEALSEKVFVTPNLTNIGGKTEKQVNEIMKEREKKIIFGGKRD